MISSPPLNPRLADTDGAGFPALRTKNVSGDLVSRPFEIGQCISADSVGASVTNVTAVSNKDGSGMILFVSVPAGTNGARFQQPFRGTKFGLRIKRDNLTTTPDEFSVRIDGVAYAVSTRITKAVVYGQAFEDDQGICFYIEDLAEGEHLAEVTVAAPASGTVSMRFLGYLVERRAGYQAPVQSDVLITNGNTPTVAAAIYDCLQDGSSGPGRRISKIRWQNNTGGAVTDLVVKYNGVIYAQPSSIASKDGFELTFSPPVVFNSLWTHVSSAGGANLPYFVFGSY